MHFTISELVFGMDIDFSNPVHIQVFRDLTSYGVRIPCGLLRGGKSEKKKLVQIFTPRKTRYVYNAVSCFHFAV